MKDLIDKFGRELLEEAMKPPAEGQDKISFKDKVDVFKAVAIWDLGNRRSRKGGGPRDDDTFDAVRDRINGREIHR